MSSVLAERPDADLDIEVATTRLAGGRLLDDYLDGAAAARPFFTGHPGDVAAYRRKAAEVEARLSGDARAALRDAILPLGDAAPRLERILAGDGFFVTTGQQPALFGGPLYTLYKTLSAIRTADMLETVLGRPVLALFWVGADDHDWDEANHTSVTDGHGQLQRISVHARPDLPPLPLSQRVWGQGVTGAVDDMIAALPATPYAAAIAQHLREAYTPDATVEASFTATMRLLLHDRRIALISSADPLLRRAAVPVLAREVAHAGEHFRRVDAQTRKVAAAGYPVQVTLADDASNLMLLDEAGRDRLLWSERGWSIRRERRPIPPDSLLARLHGEPDRFSPNVLLRPVVESATLPTVAYVAGPGEARYFAQIGCLFTAHGIVPPVVVPRASATLIEPRVRRTLDKLGLEPADFGRTFDDLAALIARRHVPPAATQALQSLHAATVAAYEQLIGAVEPLDPTLRGPLTAARNRSLIQAREAERRILRHAKRRYATTLAMLGRAAASLAPGGKPQERVLNALPFVARYGPALVARLERAFEPLASAPVSWSGPDCG